MFARRARGTKSLGVAALNPLGVTRNDQAGESAQAPSGERSGGMR